MRLHFLSRSANSRAWLSVFPYHECRQRDLDLSYSPMRQPIAAQPLVLLSGYIELSRVKEPEGGAGGPGRRGVAAALNLPIF